MAGQSGCFESDFCSKTGFEVGKELKHGDEESAEENARTATLRLGVSTSLKNINRGYRQNGSGFYPLGSHYFVFQAFLSARLERKRLFAHCLNRI